MAVKVDKHRQLAEAVLDKFEAQSFEADLCLYLVALFAASLAATF